MKRRAFLRLAAVGSVVGFPMIVRAQTLGLGGGVAPSNRITLGFIGVGDKGTSSLRSVLGRDGVQVTAVCDVDRDHVTKAAGLVNAAAKNTNCATYGDLRELLARPDLDGVWISTPDHWHCLAVIFAAQAGKHVYCEKPLASSIPEGRAMVMAVQRAGIACQLGNQQRSAAEFQRAMDLVRQGHLGRIRRVCVGLPGSGNTALNPPFTPAPVPAALDYDFWVGPAAFEPYHPARVHFNWRWNFTFGCGQLGDWIQHHYDIAALALGVADQFPAAIRNAHAKLFELHGVYNTAYDYSFEAVYPDGQVIEVSSRFKGGVYLQGEHGWILVNRGSLEASDEALRRLALAENNRTMPVRDHYEAYFDAIRDGTAVTSPVTQSHCVAGVAHLANAAFRSGVADFRWDAAAERPIDAPEVERFLVRKYRAPWVLPG